MHHAPITPRSLDDERHSRRARVMKDAVTWLHGVCNESIDAPEQWTARGRWKHSEILREKDSKIPHLSMFTELLAENGYALNKGEGTVANTTEALQGRNQAEVGAKAHGAINGLLAHDEPTQQAFLLMRYRDECLKKTSPINEQAIKTINTVLAEMAPSIVKKINNNLPKGRLGENAIANINEGQSRVK